MNTLADPIAPEVAHRLTPEALQNALSDGGEIAFLDVREEGIYDANHILRAANAPLSRLELDAPRLLPRLGVRIVLSDDDEVLSHRAAAELAAAGYTDISVLAGGIQAWTAAGLPLFDGIFVPSKTFGELIEHQLDTPHISAHELTGLVANGTDLVIVDTRTA
jgi:rhodanese-related sulfurtransferase